MRANYNAWINKHINKKDFENKNVFITGSNSGIGFSAAKYFASFGANLFLLCRNIEKANQAKDDILKEFPNTKIVVIQLDLASFDSIRNCVNEVKKYDVDFFINNAGVYHLPKGVTKDGLETVMGTNFIGTMYLNNLLNFHFLSLNHKVKILFVTSITSKTNRINYSNFFGEKKYKKMSIYARSKVALNNLYYSYKENKMYFGKLEFCLMHPGGTYTPLIAKGYKNKFFGAAAKLFMKLVFHSPEKAALGMLYSLNGETVKNSGPRGLFELSGYPKEVKYKKNKDYIKCIELGNQIIDAKVAENK